MRNKFKILFSIAAALFCGNVQAQFIQAPETGPVLTNYLTGAGTTNQFAATNVAGFFTNQTVIAAGSVTNLLPTGCKSNCSPANIRLSPGSGLSFAIAAVAAAGILPAGTNFVCNFNTTIDGSNWTTANPVTATFSIGPTNALISGGGAAFWNFTNFPPTAFGNSKWVRMDSISNSIPVAITISNAIYGLYR